MRASDDVAGQAGNLERGSGTHVVSMWTRGSMHIAAVPCSLLPPFLGGSFCDIHSAASRLKDRRWTNAPELTSLQGPHVSAWIFHLLRGARDRNL